MSMTKRRFVRIDGAGQVVDTYQDDPDGFPYGFSGGLFADDEESE